MTFNEFKCWFEGFLEGEGNDPPNKRQWERIKEKIDKVVEYPVRIPSCLSLTGTTQDTDIVTIVPTDWRN